MNVNCFIVPPEALVRRSQISKGGDLAIVFPIHRHGNEIDFRVFICFVSGTFLLEATVTKRTVFIVVGRVRFYTPFVPPDPRLFI